MILANKFHQQGHREKTISPWYLQKGSPHGVVSGTLTALLVGGNLAQLAQLRLMSSYPVTTTKLLTSKCLRTSYCHQIKLFFTVTARP